MVDISSHKIGKKKTSANSQCDFCPKTFYERNLFYGHARKHHMDIIGDTWVKCDICSNLYPDGDTIARHKRTAHHGGRCKDGTDSGAKVKCEYCDQAFRQTRSYYGHANAYHLDVIKDKWFQCPDCKTLFPTSKTLRCHKQASSCNDRDAAQGFQCEYCPVILSKNYIFFQHANKKHFEKICDSWLPCPKCGLHLPNEVALTKHNSNKHPSKEGPRNALCSFCPAILGSTNNFIKHANAKHREIICTEWLLCPDCPMYLPSLEYMSNHRPLAHRDLIPLSERIPCMFCKKLYSSDQGLNRHVNQHHYDKICKDWFKCDVCQDFFQTNQNLVNHKSAAHKKLKDFGSKRSKQCQFCEKTFSESSKYFKHANKCHTQEVSKCWERCDDCSKHYPNQVSLNQHKLSHKEKQHRKEKTRCQFCPDVFDKRNQYSQHVNKEHFNIISKEWNGCDDCKLFFPTVELLMAHIELTRHVSQLPKIECQFCPDSLIDLNEFYSHANAVHPDLVSKDWIKCQTCCNFFPRIKVLKIHKKTCQGTTLKSSPVQKTKASKRTVQCDFCSETLKSQTLFHKHANERHLEEILVDWRQCDLCSNFFPNSISLSNHRQKCSFKASSNRQIKCQYCRTKLKNQISYYSHAKERHLEIIIKEWQKCDTCTGHFPSGKELEQHLPNCLPGSDSKLKEEQSDQNADDLEECDLNGNEDMSDFDDYSGILDYGDDSEYVLNGKRSKIEAEPTVPQCPLCQCQFVSSFILNRHLKEGSCLDNNHSRTCHHCLQIVVDIDNHVCGAAPIKMEEDDKHFLNVLGDFCEKADTFLEPLVSIKSEENVESSVPDPEDLPLRRKSKKPVKSRPKQKDESKNLDSETEAQEEGFPLKTKKAAIPEVFAKDEISNKYKCIHCYLTFIEENTLRTHIEEAHLDINLDCEECDKTFANGIKLKQHYATVHIAHKNYECQTCQQRFRARSQLSRHALQAKHSCTFVCGRCCESFSTYALYTEHLMSDRHSNLECKFCSKSFTDSKHLKEHMKRLHLDGKNFVCQVCSKKFFTKAQLGKHCDVNKHASIFECAKCDDAFPTYDQYKEHLSAVHPISVGVRNPSSKRNDVKNGYQVGKDGNRYIECPDCGKRFTNITNMKKHIKVVHLNIRDYICEICSKAFAESRDLRSHIQLVHLKQKNFQCESCGRKFGENKKLRRHILAKHPDLLQ